VSHDSGNIDLDEETIDQAIKVLHLSNLEKFPAETNHTESIKDEKSALVSLPGTDEKESSD
jgi:hypothetical protein